ncbi:MAG: methionyl-tRNA formyltransferase [Candidatus Accumulibacter sp.]|nr:methionyl-tRNA formyltransferase [Accumulibacter sp.]
MRVCFAGTPAFAAVALRAIADAGHQVPLVLSQPDRPAGRGLTLQPSPVKQLATALGIEVYQPTTLRDPAAQDRLRDTDCELLVVAAYGLILPQAVLDLPRYGGINIHASLLPRWRGAAPIQRALLAGDAQTGVCIMRMEAALDTGPVLLAEAMPIATDDTAGSLQDKLAELGARLVRQTLAAPWPMPATPQAAEGVTYAAKIDKREAILDWRQPASRLERQIRAFDPVPGAFFTRQDQSIKVWRAEVVSDAGGAPGTVLAADRRGIVVACGEAALRLTELQQAGGRRLPAAQFLAGTPVRVGEICRVTT